MDGAILKVIKLTLLSCWMNGWSPLASASDALLLNDTTYYIVA